MPSIFHVRYTVPPMPLERDIAKFIKNGSIFYLIFRVYHCHNSGIWEKWPPTLFICSPIGGHMQIFRNFWRLIFEIVYSGTYFCIIVKALSRRRTLPAPPWLQFDKRRGHLAATAIGCRFTEIGIRRRRACLGMPTDGGRCCWYVGVSWNDVKCQWCVTPILKPTICQIVKSVCHCFRLSALFIAFAFWHS